MTPRRYIFIVGSQRTGTTLLGQILGAHPQAVLIDENNSVYSLIETLLETPEDEEATLRQCLASARRLYVEDDRFDDHDTLGESVSHLVLKAPNATYAYEGLRHIHKGRLHFVFAVRDVRDVVCSMQRLVHVPMVDNQLGHIARYARISARFAEVLAKIRSPDTAESVRRALIWRIKTSLYTEFLPAPLRAFLIRYEDLVRAPNRWIPRILDHVGLSPQTEAVLHHEDVFQGVGPGFTVRTRAIDTTSLSRWQRDLDPEEEEAIWDVAGGLMTALGYARHTRPSGAPIHPRPCSKTAAAVAPGTAPMLPRTSLGMDEG